MVLLSRSARLRWVFSLLLACPPVGVAYSQTSIEDSKSLPSSIAPLKLDLNPTESSELAKSLAAHDYTTAEKLLLGEINRDPSSLRAASLLSIIGSVYFLNADYLNAAIAWKKSEKIAPLDPSAEFSLAMVYVRLGRAEWALPLLRSLAKDRPNEPLYPYWLGRLDYDAQRYDSAIAQFRRALSIKPDMSRAYDNLGLCYFSKNNTALAIENYTQAIDLDRKSIHQSAWPHLNLAIALHLLSRLDEAEAQLHEALRIDPNLARAQFELGLVLEAGQHFDTAIGALLCAAKVDAAYADPHYALARIYSKQGQKTLAQREVEIYQRLRSDAHPTTNPQVH